MGALSCGDRSPFRPAVEGRDRAVPGPPGCGYQVRRSVGDLRGAGSEAVVEPAPEHSPYGPGRAGSIRVLAGADGWMGTCRHSEGHAVVLGGRISLRRGTMWRRRGPGRPGGG